MGNKLYVGNLAYSTNEDSLSDFFADVCKPRSVKIITDRETGRSKGFGFVETETPEEAEQIMAQFNGSELDGRPLKISEARERTDRSSGNRW